MDKKQLTETDIRTKYITPAIVGTLNAPKWDVMTQIPTGAIPHHRRVPHGRRRRRTHKRCLE